MWKTMEKIQKSGRARSIGVSNFLKPHLERILATATIIPAVNQIEYHPYLQHGDLVQFCRSSGIAVTAYSTLTAITKAAPGPVDGAYDALAQKYAVAAGDVAMRWCIDQNIAVITTSSSEQRLQSISKNLWSFQLSEDEVGQISSLGRQKHHRVLYNRRFTYDQYLKFAFANKSLGFFAEDDRS